ACMLCCTTIIFSSLKLNLSSLTEVLKNDLLQVSRPGRTPQAQNLLASHLAFVIYISDDFSDTL
ncbi:MAG: hypothetical protein K6B67_09465, partial [Lachnospiraceae bacterium]|nr:hypothetical protein [Lachnospiraceae bacterium]